MSRARIVWLEAGADTDDRVIGPKALGLIRLIWIGQPVPAGFCVTAEACRERRGAFVSHAESIPRSSRAAPPAIVIGRFDPEQSPPQAVGESENTLHGVAASAGVATGPARVILRADTDEQVQAGEILVAPFTDPGWTPYFVPAAGIVTEQGGLLSHGSIIAREHGLPAVVNVPGATKIIRTGQRLQVDGNRGTVTILE